MRKPKLNKIKDNLIENLTKKFKTITKEPEQFLKEQPEKCMNIRELLQNTYKVTTQFDLANTEVAEMLPEILVDDMDDEQIWQQLELRNEFVLNQFVENTSKLLAMNEEKLEIRLDESDEENEEEDIDEEGDESESTSFDEDEEDNNSLKKDGTNNEIVGDDNDNFNELEEEEVNLGIEDRPKRKKKYRSTIVDDKFFKLGEMEEYLAAEDAKEMKREKGKPKADDGIDYFDENLGGDEDSEEGDMNYKDFFEDDIEESQGKDYFDEEYDKNLINELNDDKEYLEDPADDNEGDADDVEEEEELYGESCENMNKETISKEERNLQPDSASDSDSESNNEDEQKEQTKSSFELRQERLEHRIREYEEEVLGEKPWQLKGEIQASNRPQNSLLEEVLEFESTARPAPIITEETTKCLEDIIKQRIKDKAWDDVVRTVVPIHNPQEYRKQLVLDQEKSKQSLAQIYEKEYQDEMEKQNTGLYDEPTEDEPKEHTEIRLMMQTLFAKLDALFHHHFTPMPVMPEPKIITNTPAIEIEEVAPIGISDANLLAPEEVYRGPKNGLMGKSERTRTDKNRERRKKKQKQRAVKKILEEKDLHRQKMGIPLSKKEESAKIMKTITKHRNVQKVTTSNDQGSLKSSKAFFSKLQDATNSANIATKAKKKKSEENNTSVSAKKFKL